MENKSVVQTHRGHIFYLSARKAAVAAAAPVCLSHTASCLWSAWYLGFAVLG